MEKIKYEYTKTPLEYQITEYDCGTTTLLNALRYLFKRSEIEPEIYKFIMQYTLDNTNKDGEIGKGGTSVYAMRFLSDWINNNASKKGMKMKSIYINGESVSIYNEILIQKIENGAVALLRLYQDVEHYCLLTKLDDKFAYLFDPYYLNINYYDKDDEVEIIKDRPFEFNRKVKKERVENGKNKDFSLVKGKNSEIIIIEKY